MQPAPSAAVDPDQQAHLVLDLRYHWLGFILGLVTPMIAINGNLMTGRWGRNMIPVPPGQNHVHIHLPYFLPPRIGPADTTVWLEPGEMVELEYRAPLLAFARGALGPAPQEWPGKVVMYVMMGLLGFFMLLILISFIAAAVS